MEKITQVINTSGLQIPLPLVERYGLQPGASVILEMDEYGIHIVPALPGQEEIENLALRYLLKHLGDAVTIQVEQKDSNWRVIVFGVNLARPLGHLTFSLTGEFNPEKSTSLQTMRQAATTVVVNQ